MSFDADSLGSLFFGGSVFRGQKFELARSMNFDGAYPHSSVIDLNLLGQRSAAKILAAGNRAFFVQEKLMDSYGSLKIEEPFDCRPIKDCETV